MENTTSIEKRFSERLAELVFDKDISWEKLAENIGVSRTTVYRWKLKPQQISLTNLVLLADYFECSIEFLIGRTDDYLKVESVELPVFSVRVREIMKERGISTYRLRQISRFDGKYFEVWDRNTDPTFMTLIELAEILDCTIDYLVGRER